MQKIILPIVVIVLLLFLFNCEKSNTEPEINNETIVEHFGQLQVSGNKILDQNDEIIVLRGMSLFWSQWGGTYYNKETISWLRDDWKCTVIRAAIGVESGGYLENKTVELEKLYKVIDACIDLGIYVIVDWHDHHGEDHIFEAMDFFRRVSSKYGGYPNIIYEIYNEPLDVSWINVLKPYAEAVISEIRKNDSDNLIVVGTPNSFQDVEDVIGKRLDDNNVAYSLHFYTGTHGQFLREKAFMAISANIPLFASEWGLSEANGTGDIDLQETNLWTYFLERYDLSWCDWSIVNKDESSAALLPSTSTLSGWSEDELSESGKMIRNYLIKMNTGIFENLN